MNWIHRLFNPHCEKCKQEEVDKIATQIELDSEARSHELELNNARLKNQIEMNRCYSCEVLERQLSEANSVIRSLLEPKKEETDNPPIDFKPIASGRRWSVVQRELEAEDRKKAELLKTSRLAEITVENLEEALKPNA